MISLDCVCTLFRDMEDKTWGNFNHIIGVLMDGGFETLHSSPVLNYIPGLGDRYCLKLLYCFKMILRSN